MKKQNLKDIKLNFSDPNQFSFEQDNNIDECGCKSPQVSLSLDNSILLNPNTNKRRTVSPSILKEHWVTGEYKLKERIFPQASSQWTWKDRWGAIKSRTSAYRDKYMVEPGIYAIGTPDVKSDVFVSANYKLSFDKLRHSLEGLNGWILVLDTKGINVWCAAGKGTFGTAELINRIQNVELKTIVDHKRLIVPQLGAVGVNAKEVKNKTGFRVYFGPVLAKDLKPYIEARYKATEKMRKVPFSIIDRIILTPMEMNPAMKKFPLYLLSIFILFGLGPEGILFKDAYIQGMPFFWLGLLTVFSGAFFTPTMLPFIPFRSFAVKGWLSGVLIVHLYLHYAGLFYSMNWPLLVIAYLFFPMLSSYIALQFTGSTTYTGMTGVKKELKIAVPIYITAAVITGILSILYKLMEWRIV